MYDLCFCIKVTKKRFKGTKCLDLKERRILACIETAGEAQKVWNKRPRHFDEILQGSMTLFSEAFEGLVKLNKRVKNIITKKFS